MQSFPKNPFTQYEQRLCLMSIMDLRAELKDTSWKAIENQWIYLAAIPGIRQRLGK